MPRGYQDLETEAAKIGKGGGGKYIRHVALKQDKESITFRFLTEHDDIWFDKFHRFQAERDGKTFWTTEVCSKTFGVACRFCAKEEWPRMEILAWVFAFYQDHPKRTDAPGSDDWEKVKVGATGVRFRETLNKPLLFRYSATHRGPISTLVEDEGSIINANVEWVRTGEPRDTRVSYNIRLSDYDSSELDDTIANWAATLPELEDVAMNRTRRYDGKTDDEDSEERADRTTRVVTDEDDEGDF